MQKRALAGAVRSQECGDLVLLYIEGNAPQCLSIAVEDVDVLYLK
jgi:hypothetical protein